MNFTLLQFKRISVFFYLLSLLLLFNLYFNISHTWFGVSLIVRVYLYVFSFYLVYIYNMQGSKLVEKLRPMYEERYGEKGDAILAFESRILPFIFIAVITFLYTLIYYVNSPHWPSDPLLLIISGRYANLLVYSVIFNFILNIRRRPLYAVPIFVVISIVYFVGDKMIASNFPVGPAVSMYKITKFILFFFIFFYGFSGRAGAILKTAVRATVCSIILYAVMLGLYFGAYKISEGRGYFVRREAGLALTKLGYPLAMGDLQNQVFSHKDVTRLSVVFNYGDYYDMFPDFPDKAWQALLFSQKSDLADTVAQYMLMLGKKAPYDLLASYVDERIKKGDVAIVNMQNFLALTAQSVKGNEKNLMWRMDISRREFAVWGIRVLAGTGDVNTVPMLLRYLGDVDENVSKEAYSALRVITKIDPAQEKKIHINDPEVFYQFKKLYLEKRIGAR
jgi:hypothetical protein